MTVSTVAPDLSISREFLDLLAGGPGARFTFQTFDDNEDRKDRRLVRVLHGTLDETAPELVRLNEAGAGVFVTVNQTDLRGRKAGNVTALRALFIDKDDAPPGAFPIEPSLIVGREEDRDRYHAYWPLRPGEPRDLFTPAQKALVAFYGSDRKVCDLPRVLRLPGLLHRKGPPQLVRILRRGPEVRHSIEDVMRAHRAWPIGRQENAAPLPPPDGSAEGTERMGDFDGRLRRCAAYIEKIPDAVSGNRGHDRCLRAACECFRFGLSDGQAREVLDWFNGAKCRPPFSRAELDHKLADAKKKVLDAGELGSRLKADTKPLPKAACDFTAAGIVLVVEDARKPKVRWSANVRVFDAGTGEDLGSLPVSVTPSGLRAGEKDLRELLRRKERVLESREEGDLLSAFRHALDPKNLARVERAQSEREAMGGPGRETGPGSMRELGRAYLVRKLRPAFVGTRGKPWSEALGRTVESDDLAVTPSFVAELDRAFDFVRSTPMDPMKPEHVARDVLRVAWAGIREGLPDELGADLGPSSKAAAAVRRQIVRAFTSVETWSKEVKKGPQGEEETHVARASAVTRTLALKLSAGGKSWLRVLPGCDCWARLDSQGRIRWAIRFSFVNGQIKGATIERACDQRALTDLLRKYGMLDDKGDPPDRLPGRGTRIAVLSADLCDEILGQEEVRTPETGEGGGEVGGGSPPTPEVGPAPAGETGSARRCSDCGAELAADRWGGLCLNCHETREAGGKP